MSYNNEIYNTLLKQTFGIDDSKIESIVQNIESRVSILETNFDKFMEGIKLYLEKQNKQLNLWRNNLVQDVNAHLEKVENELKIWKQKSMFEHQKLIDNKIAKITIQDIDKYSVKVDTYTDKEIDGLFRLKEVSGSGFLRQLMIKTTSTDYTIYILIDDRLLFEKPYTYFSDYSDYLSNVSAFSDSGYYYFSVRLLDFQEKLIINIKTDSALTFDEIVLKYSIRDEEVL